MDSLPSLRPRKEDVATLPPLKGACNRDQKEHNRTLTQNTGPLCPCKDLRHVHVLMSHSFNKWSLECEERNCINNKYYCITVTLKEMY